MKISHIYKLNSTQHNTNQLTGCYAFFKVVIGCLVSSRHADWLCHDTYLVRAKFPIMRHPEAFFSTSNHSTPKWSLGILDNILTGCQDEKYFLRWYWYVSMATYMKIRLKTMKFWCGCHGYLLSYLIFFFHFGNRHFWIQHTRIS